MDNSHVIRVSEERLNQSGSHGGNLAGRRE